MKFYEIVIFHMVTLPVDLHGSVTTKFFLTVHVLISWKDGGCDNCTSSKNYNYKVSSGQEVLSNIIYLLFVT